MIARPPKPARYVVSTDGWVGGGAGGEGGFRSLGTKANKKPVSQH